MGVATGSRRFLPAWLGSSVLLALLAVRCGGIYHPVEHIETARIYGNIDHFAYYFVDLLVGTPPQRVSVIVDTGSGVCAFPCASCAHCGTHIDPAFDVGKSSTARWQDCGAGCAGSCGAGHCSYYQGYTEGSSISGYWFRDLVRIGDSIQRNPAVNGLMGCHQNENNLFYTQRANGILGIGPSSGRDTLLHQLFADNEHVQSSTFTLCLADWGGVVVVGGHNASYHTGSIQWVPMQRNTGFYHVGLSEMSINGQSLSRSWGRTMIDSGTTYCYMGTAAYQGLKNGIESYCRAHSSCGSVQSGECWQVPDISKFPTITVSFGGVATSWGANSYMYRKGQTKRWCYAFQDDGAGADTVLGASWMRHKDVIFDIDQYRVGIVPASCPSFQNRPTHNPAADMTLPTVPTEPPTTTTITTTSSTSTTTSTTSTTSTTLAAVVPATSTLFRAGAITGLGPDFLQTGGTTMPTNTSSPKALTVEWASHWIHDPVNQPVMAAASLVLLAILAAICYCVYRCWTRRRVAFSKLEESDEARMMPQIVGGVADADAFVIGDDDGDEESFEYVHNLSGASSPVSTPQVTSLSARQDGGLRNTGISSPRGFDS